MTRPRVVVAGLGDSGLLTGQELGMRLRPCPTARPNSRWLPAELLDAAR